jgi:Spy/CpxP family protein refolding chaperone
MKIPFLPLFLIGAVLTMAAPRIGLADTVAPAPASGANTNSDPSARLERLKAALAELNLTDDQKAQIKHIRWTVTDREERRQQILAVLTPDQKGKLKQMIQKHRNGGGATRAST